MCKQDFLHAVFVSYFPPRCDKYNVIVKDMEYQQCLYFGSLTQESPNEVFHTNLTHWYMGQKFGTGAWVFLGNAGLQTVSGF